MTPRLTHLALMVRSLDRTIAFYRKYAGLHVVHDRVDGSARVVWLGAHETDNDFVLVLIGTVADGAGEGTWQRLTRSFLQGAATVTAPLLSQVTTLRHLGFAVGSREAVDALAASGRADGMLMIEPVYAGPVVGYFCMLEDPDGNHVEFSYGQPISPRELPGQLADSAPEKPVP
jgi:catechol 2,3-dioxygenase-like lactoylglutathione lyase family enzyme